MPQETELSVLLIEDEPDAAKLIQHVLAKGGSLPVAVDWAHDLRSGLDRLTQRGYQAVLLDLNLPDSRGFETFARVRQKAATQAVIVLTGEEDEALAIQTVRAGADDYLLKSDVRDRFLVQRIRYAVERNRLKIQDAAKGAKNGRIFSFVGAKGGSGTTTLVVNLAAALAKLGKSVTAMEFTPDFSSMPVLLNHSPASDISTLLRGAPEKISRDTMMPCLEEFGAGFKALCGAQRVEDYCAISPAHARAVLETARLMADYTLVDVPSTVVPSIQEIIQHSVFTTMVVERNRLGLHAALAKMPAVQALAARPGAVGVVLVNKGPAVDFLNASEFSERLGCEVLGVIPPAEDLLAGESDTLPLLRRPENYFSLAIHELARRLNAGLRSLPEQARPSAGAGAWARVAQ